MSAYIDLTYWYVGCVFIAISLAIAAIIGHVVRSSQHDLERKAIHKHKLHFGAHPRRRLGE